MMMGFTRTMFDGSTRDALIGRIETVDAFSQPQWGKMTVYQMLKHCTLWDEWVLGKRQYKGRVFIGRLVGPMVLRQLVKDDRPLSKNTPTFKPLAVTETGDVVRQKAEWIEQLAEYEGYDTDVFMHVFFGKMTKEQVGCLAYKHADHHLRQFGV
jgi:Protein of unknown function (DUF1569)